MEKLKKNRKYVRAAFTRSLKEAKENIMIEHSGSKSLRLIYEKLVRITKEMRELDEQILDAMLDDEEEEYNRERDIVETYRDEWATIELDFKERFSSESPSVISVKRSVKLPKIELAKFDGNVMGWLKFWTQFQKVDCDEELHDADKFQYLIQCMIPGTRPRELVESYPMTDKNYAKAISALKDRYGRKDLLVEIYVRELHKMALGNVSGKQRLELGQMYDTLEAHLRALESLGVTSDCFAAMLYPIIESSLPEEVLRAFQRANLSSMEDSHEKRLQKLLLFVKNEVESEERINLAKQALKKESEEHFDRKQKYAKTFGKGVPTAAGLFVGQSVTCVFCDKRHPSTECVTAQEMPLSVKREKSRNRRVCFLCLKPGHNAKACRTFLKCVICSKGHVPVMCPDLNRPSKEPQGVNSGAMNPPPTNSSVLTVQNNKCTSDILLQTIELSIEVNGKQVRVRALLDPGSQRSYILRSTAEALNLEPVGSQRLCHILFGGKEESSAHSLYSIILSNGKGTTLKNVKVLDQNCICGVIPRMRKGAWMQELKKEKIWVPDLGEGQPEIQLLIGSDYYGRIMTGRKCDLSNGLTALQTVFGWVLSGQRNDDSSFSGVVTSMYLSERNVQDLWSLETLGIQDPSTVKSSLERDEQVMTFFDETIGRNSEGRYSIKLPWVENCQKMADNKDVAMKRLMKTTMRLQQNGMFQNYSDIFEAWEAEGIIEEVPEEEKENGKYYLPHRAVVKMESSTTPIRPVFDASSKTYGSPSLNDCVEKGPNLLKFVPSIIMRFRLEKIGFVSDIRKAFQMIEVDPSDRDFLRFLWWEDASAQKVKIFRHRRVVFGVKSSPFLLAAVIRLHLKNVDADEKEAADFLMNAFYVDNCVASLDSLDEYELFKTLASKIMADAKMDLRQWERSCLDKNDDWAMDSHCLEEQSGKTWVTTVLGLSWDRQSDTLCCVTDVSDSPALITKRNVLALLNKIYDPIGFIAPVTVGMKLFLQKLWQQKLGWDEQLSEEDQVKINSFVRDVKRLSEVKIPRHIAGGFSRTASKQIHCFSDASQDAYAAVIFIRVEENDNCSVQLIQAKLRIAPLKRMTIPRLELMGCVIGARLTQHVIEAMNYENIPVFYWTDSTTVLAWIRRKDNWNVFVSNRVKEIRSLSDVGQWRHVPGIMNPADLISRGCSLDTLLTSRWWEGPCWLYESPLNWPPPETEILIDETVIESEKKRCANAAVAINLPNEENCFDFPFSTYSSNVRLVAWILRFYKGCRKISSSSGQLTVEEINIAEKYVFRKVQSEAFPKNEEHVSGISLLKDEDGLLRVKTRLLNREDTSCFKLPVILPNKHPLVDQMIMEEHLLSGHGGVQLLMSKLRERVWILQGRRACQRVLKSCRKCLRHTSKPFEVDPSSLPENRVKNAAAFEITGVDLAGPLFLRNGTKAWIVLFTCGIFRCVWLDFVTSINTEAFLDALQRFIACCGRPKTIYSDNGTNFVGARNLLKGISWTKIQAKSSVQRIQWILNPPTAAWWGGWWERLIRSVKDLLKRMLGKARVDSQQLRTCLAIIQSAINDRPLTYVTEDKNDLVPLTPAMFLRPLNGASFPELSEPQAMNLHERYRQQKNLLVELKQRFRSEYLSLLIQRAKERRRPCIAVDDVVLIGSDAKKRIEWPLGRVMELLPGKDGKVRVCRVRSAYGTFLRPVQRLYSLELSHIETQSLQKRKVPDAPSSCIPTSTPDDGEPREAARTARGREIKRVDRYMFA